MSNASLFPCTNCKTTKHKLGECGQERTIPSLAHDYERFVTETNSDRNLGKLYFGQVDMPLLFETLEEHKNCLEKVNDHIVPSCLHIFLGIGNHFVQELGELWPDIVTEWVIYAQVS